MMNKRIEVKTRDGKVVLDVGGQEEYLVAEPGLSFEIGRSMIDAAVSLGLEVSVETPRREVSALQRQGMIVRCDHVMRSLQQKPRKIVAVHVVDTLLEML